MKNKRAPAKRYLSEINRQLFFMGKDKNKLIGKISNDINSFSGENPDCTYDDIVKIFGKPSEIAQGQLNDDVLIERYKKSRLIKNMLLGVFGLAIIALAAVIVYIIMNDALFYVKTIVYYN